MVRKKPRPTQYPDVTGVKSVMETRVFRSGNSYAIRLPKPLYSGGEGAVLMKKLDNGRLLITPKSKKRWPIGFFESFGDLAGFEAPARPGPSAADDARVEGLFTDDE